MASHDDDNAHKPIISHVQDIYCGGMPFLEDVIPLRNGRTSSPSFDETKDIDIEAHKIKKENQRICRKSLL